MRKALPAAMLALLASGCASGSASSNYVRTGAPAAQPAPSPTAAFRAPPVTQGTGVDSVIGQAANSLTNRFGEARIDRVEGDARKLQFVSDACVLDIYLYPVEAGSAPVASYIDARLRQGGANTDNARCIADVELAANGG